MERATCLAEFSSLQDHRKRRGGESQDERAGVRHFRQDHISLKIHFEARITPPFLKLFLINVAASVASQLI